jgi:hypothetical protein
MNTIVRSFAVPQAARSDDAPEAVAELRRHHVDLRVHALIMLSGAILAGYCGIQTLDYANTARRGGPGDSAVPLDMLSICALAMFFAIAALCLLEARRGWRKSATLDAMLAPRVVAARPTRAVFRLGV